MFYCMHGEFKWQLVAQINAFTIPQHKNLSHCLCDKTICSLSLNNYYDRRMQWVYRRDASVNITFMLFEREVVMSQRGTSNSCGNQICVRRKTSVDNYNYNPCIILKRNSSNLHINHECLCTEILVCPLILSETEVIMQMNHQLVQVHECLLSEIQTEAGFTRRHWSHR